ncbi:putative O-methyltransferase [Hypomontagnella monticulosa]|nr:putative O-methyltransferase [Hypomontagnella monticulosa]
MNAEVLGRSQIDTIIENLGKLGPKLSSGDQGARQEALQLSRKLTTSLEDPTNIAVDLIYLPFRSVAARIAIDLDLFNLIIKHGDSVTSTELASLSGGEELLIIRILRPLAIMGFVEEVGERRWRATPITRAMAREEIAAGHRMFETIVAAAMKGPKFLREAGHRAPLDPSDGFIQYAFQTKLSTFDFYSSIPQLQRDFDLCMGNVLGARQNWLDWFPVEERILDGADKRSPLLVDVGGGKGHDILAFHEKYPRNGGRLILQDLAPAINNVLKVDSSIETMVHNFFTEQPVKGARAYYYHYILHDWSDSVCLDILKNARAAMKPGYSKLILNEMIVSDRGASMTHASMDMTMLAFCGGMERTERQWRELLGKAGLEVVRVWLPPQEDATGIVEAMVKE